MGGDESQAGKGSARRSFDRFCPLSLTLDQIGERWTLHIIMALLAGPKRYSELKHMLAGAGTNILSDRLRNLVANRLVSRTTGDAPGSETRYRLTERGGQLGPVIGGLATWGLDLLNWTAPGSDEKEREVFDQAWATDPAIPPVHETYQWSIDGVEFELTVKGAELIRTRGRAAHPAVTLKASNAVLADIVTGRRSVADAVDAKQLQLKGSRRSTERMFNVIGFPLVRLGFSQGKS
jgi:DNA-binding HxlR family transcriptional regulator